MDQGVGTRAKKWTVSPRGTRKKGLKEEHGRGDEGGWNGFGVRVKGLLEKAFGEPYVWGCQGFCVLEWGLQGTT